VSWFAYKFFFKEPRVTRHRQSRHKLVTGNWNITSLTGKEHKPVEEAKQYSLNVVRISSTKHLGSDTGGAGRWIEKHAADTWLQIADLQQG